jgi:hypothetical protein
MGKKMLCPPYGMAGIFIRQGRIKASLFCQVCFAGSTIEKLCFLTMGKKIRRPEKRHK